MQSTVRCSMGALGIIIIFTGSLFVLLSRPMWAMKLHFAKKNDHKKFFKWQESVLNKTGPWLFVVLGLLLIAVGVLL